jgi:N utilization substance protein A
VGSCVGQKGVRVQAVTNELGGERVDIIPWTDDVSEFIKASLSPVTVLAIDLHQEGKTATVTVPADQLSLAIGKEGQNVRLASKLTGWGIDVVGQDMPEDAEPKEAINSSEQPLETPETQSDVIPAASDVSSTEEQG